MKKHRLLKNPKLAIITYIVKLNQSNSSKIIKLERLDGFISGLEFTYTFSDNEIHHLFNLIK